MTTNSRKQPLTREPGAGQKSHPSRCRFNYPMRFGLLLCLLLGHASLQAQVLAPLPNIVLEAGDQINAVVVQSDGRVIIGGRFTRVSPRGGNAIDKSFLARFNSDGTIDQNFNVDINGEVSSLVLDGTVLYVGGDFNKLRAKIDSVTFLDYSIENLAKIVLTDPYQQVESFTPGDVDGPVMTIAVDADDVYVGGYFSNCGGQPQEYFCGMDKAGLLDNRFDELDLNGAVKAIAIDSNSPKNIYLGGEFTTITNFHRTEIISRNHLAMLFMGGGGDLRDWNPNANGNVNALALDGSTLIIGGEFTSISGTDRNRIARVDSDQWGGFVTNWNPNANSAVQTLVLDGTDVYAGGNFTSIGGQSRNYAARLDGSTGQADSWDPSLNGYVNVILPTSPPPGKSFPKVYIGGSFSRIDGPVNSQPPVWYQDNIVRVEKSTGEHDYAYPDFFVNAFADLSLNAMVRASDGSLYAGGSFFRAGGQSISHLLRITPSGALDSSWNPNPNLPVNALALDGGSLYVGGEFDNIGGQSRNRIARIDVTTNLSDGWDPDADFYVRTLLVDGQTVYAGGDFTSIGGQSRNRIARLSTSDGLADSWNPNANSLPNPSSAVYALILYGEPPNERLIVGGDFTNIAGEDRNYIASLLTSTPAQADITWTPEADFVVQAFALDGTKLYVGGDFGFIGGQTRHKIARLDADSLDGTADGWDPVPQYPSGGPRISALAVAGNSVYVGGRFISIGGQTRNNIARLDTQTDTNQADSWNPNPNGTVSALATGGDGVVYTGGSFTQIGGETRIGLAKILDTAQTCGGGWDVVGGKWNMVSLPCDPLIWNQVGDLFGDELGFGTYGNGNDWRMYDHDPISNQYSLLDIDSQVQQGAGYWLKSDNSAHLDMEGDLTGVIDSVECATIDAGIEGCYEIALTPPPDVDTARRWNMVGHPFPYAVSWADARIVVSETAYTPFDAEHNQSFSLATIQKYEDGSGYQPYDDSTPDRLGVLNPGEGFWFAVTDHTLTNNIKLLIPAKPAQVAANDLPGTTDYSLFAGAWTILREVADFMVPSAYAARGGQQGKPPKDDNPGHQRREARLQGKEWFVRLIAECPDEGLKDRGTTLGQLADSELGYDFHDLEEMSPFTAPYLTIVFPHGDWGEKSGNYASDYHPLSKGKSRGDAWQFEVRTDQPGREITLRWVMQGEYPQEPLLINVETGETVAVDPAVPGSYTFVMDGTTQRFEWMY